MNPESPGPCLIIGCGYLGLRVAKFWRDRGRHVLAVTRSKSAQFAAMGIEPVMADVLKPETLKSLPKVETVVYAVGWDRKSGNTMRDVYLDGLANVLKSLPTPERFLFVSSSSVYGQTDGSMVDETSLTEPVEESGQIVLAAEQLLRSQLPFATILRFAGIYGPDRILRKAALLKGEPLIGDAEKWINLIHVGDGVQAVDRADSFAGETFNIADDEPVTRRNLYTYLSELLGAPSAQFEPGQSGRGDTNRRIQNAKAKKMIDFVPEYPNYRLGFTNALASID